MKILLGITFLLITNCAQNPGINRSVASIEIDPIFGPEFSFTNADILAAQVGDQDSKNPVNLKYLEIAKEKALDSCSVLDCDVIETADKHGKAYKIQFKNGLWVQMSVDTGCLEFQTSPQTIASYKNNRFLINELTFELAKEAGLSPHERIGGGHINLDFKTSIPNNNYLLFRNFVVDQANNPELIWGIFGNSLGNSPPISALEPWVQEEFKRVIKEHDKLYAKGSFDDLKLIRKLTKAIEKEVYVTNPQWLHNNKTIWTPGYFQHLSFKSMWEATPVGERRIELRGFRPQKTYQEFLLELEFIKARLNFLNRFKAPKKMDIPKTHLISLKNKILKFDKILMESGLEESKYRIFKEGKIPIESKLKTKMNTNALKAKRCSAAYLKN